MNISKSRLTALLLILATIVAISPLIHTFSPIKGNVISVLALFTVFFIKSSWKKVSKAWFIGTLGLILLAFIPTLYWQEPRMMLIPIYFILSMLVISVLNKDDIKNFVDLISWAALILLFLAIIGTFYAYLGGGSILEFANEDGRPNQLYLTTLTNAQFGNYIRPSGIFDEPGALSFVVCFVAALRHVLGCNKKVTWILLIFGFVTTSVAHLIYTLLHAAEELKDNRRVKNIFIVAAIVICLLMLMALVQPIRDIFDRLLLSRFSDANLSSLGQDRIITLVNAVRYINIETFFFSLDSNCAVGLENCVDIGFENYGDNPLTLLVHWGGIVAFPYYLVLVYLAIQFVRLRSFVMLGVLFWLLHRPYTMSYGYSMLIVLTIFVFPVKPASNDIRKISTTPKPLGAEPSA
jgi:hypothetical protein